MAAEMLARNNWQTMNTCAQVRPNSADGAVLRRIQFRSMLSQECPLDVGHVLRVNSIEDPHRIDKGGRQHKLEVRSGKSPDIVSESASQRPRNSSPREQDRRRQGPETTPCRCCARKTHVCQSRSWMRTVLLPQPPKKTPPTSLFLRCMRSRRPFPDRAAARRWTTRADLQAPAQRAYLKRESHPLRFKS